MIPPIRPAPPVKPVWIAHPNGRKHFWLNTRTGRVKYTPPELPLQPHSGNPEMESNSEPD